jgi:hypothetical protein
MTTVNINATVCDNFTFSNKVLVTIMLMLTLSLQLTVNSNILHHDNKAI